MINFEPSMPVMLLPAITFLMISFGTRFTVISNLIRKIHDESSEKTITKTKGYRNRINSEISALNTRLLLTQVLQVTASLSFLLSVISVLLILLNIEYLSLTFFISGLIALVISIILFIIEITISSRSLRVHITDVENEDN